MSAGPRDTCAFQPLKFCIFDVEYLEFGRHRHCFALGEVDTGVELVFRGDSGIWQSTARRSRSGRHRLLYRPVARGRRASAIILHEDEAQGFVGVEYCKQDVVFELRRCVVVS